MALDLKDALGTWYPVLSHLFMTDEFKQIGMFLAQEEAYKHDIQPRIENIFRAFKMCPYEKLKVIIIGQDPYPGGEADGLAFSSKYHTRPDSLKVIFEELELEGLGVRTNNNLDDWAEQGVLLLNTHLTTLRYFVNAHSNIGWDWFTGEVLQTVSARRMGANIVSPMIIMAWGSPAKEVIRKNMVRDLDKDIYFLQSPHPAAQKHGWKYLGNNHFKLANKYLIDHDVEPIKWV